MITLNASTTKSPPTMARTSSCLVLTAIAPRAPPRASDPVSPMNTAAGGALYHKNPQPAAKTGPAVKIRISPVPGT